MSSSNESSRPNNIQILFPPGCIWGEGALICFPSPPHPLLIVKGELQSVKGRGRIDLFCRPPPPSR